MFLYGFVGRIFQTSIARWLSTYPGSVAFVVPLMVPHGLFVGNGDPSVFIKAAFGVLLAASVLLLIGRLGLPEIGSRTMCRRTVRQSDLLGNQCGGLGGRLAVMK